MKRNLALDYTKLILSFLVVAIHNPVFWEHRFASNLIINGLARTAVPCFFILNGLYIVKVVEDKNNLKKYLKKLGVFYLVWMVIYAPFYLFSFRKNMTISILQNIESIFFGFWHLWYIVGLIGGVSLLYIFKKLQFKDKKLFLMSIILFLTGWIIQKIELFYPNLEGLIGSLIRSNAPSRNFIFMGFPFITFGYLLTKGNVLRKINNKPAAINLMIIGLILIFIETISNFYIIGRRGFDFYLGLLIFCPAIVIYLNNKYKVVNVKDDFISKLSASIYFIHPLILFWVHESFPDMGRTGQYVLIMFFSITLGTSLIQANKSLKIFF
ncbi:hypothetical protein IX49_13240 [Cellulophaga lytica]|uniref:acyltransferase family protein n=1 Tax=Cellulophaga lytica TaxID=979 RepID=UPI0004F733B9|nr:acyltransferase family protein [Cellulophaga lytica]AIM61437.1 hypothetical protein IX49_13240 [Cellulophaga lytica]MDO6853304.1 acyltransferase family protein [Cellulophaga lytica]